MSRSADFLNWLEDQNGYAVRHDKVEKEFPALSFNLVGCTMQYDDDGNVLIPKRDYRDALIHGKSLD